VHKMCSFPISSIIQQAGRNAELEVRNEDGVEKFIERRLLYFRLHDGLWFQLTRFDV